MTGKWILRNPAIVAFLSYFGISVDPMSDPELFKQALREVDPRYKGGLGVDRFRLEQDQTKWSRETIEIIMVAAKALGLLDQETQLKGHIDMVIALGGARQSNLDRLRYAADAVKTGKASIKNLVIAGSNRILSDVEKENVSNYAPNAETEADLCKAAASMVERENPGMRIQVVVSENEKAGNPEVIESALREIGVAGDYVAVVTTQIYKMAAGLDLARVANKFGISLTTAAGNPSDPAIVAKRTTATYLSEVLRTLRAAILFAQECE